MVNLKKYIFIALLAILPVMPLWAQTSTFAVGVRGGGQTWLPEKIFDAENVANNIGGEGLIEFRYTYYGHVGRILGLGITAGLDAGYSTSGFHGTQNLLEIWDGYYRTLFPNIIIYNQTEQFMRTDVSLMLALHAGGFVLNVGPRLMMPFFAKETTGARTNDAQTGLPIIIEKAIYESSSAALPLCNVLMGIEAGWEFPVGPGALGVQAYADISVWNNQKLIYPVWYEQNSALMVVEISSWNDVPKPLVNSANGIIQKRRLVDFGIRLYYSFYANASPRRARPCPPWDTRLHHNRYGGR